jgi:hypothetical protein
MKRNLLYENRCEMCNTTEKKEKGGKSLKAKKGIHVGERAREHEADKQNTLEDSHQIKHWLSDDQSLDSRSSKLSRTLYQVNLLK